MVGYEWEVYLTEPGTYLFLMLVESPIRTRLLRWLAHDVLPMLRRRGQYELEMTPIDNPSLAGLSSKEIMEELGSVTRAMQTNSARVDTVDEKASQALKLGRENSEKLEALTSDRFVLAEDYLKDRGIMGVTSSQLGKAASDLAARIGSKKDDDGWVGPKGKRISLIVRTPGSVSRVNRWHVDFLDRAMKDVKEREATILPLWPDTPSPDQS